MAPAALAYTYCTQDDVDAIVSALNRTSMMDDDESGTLDATEQGFVTKAINWATDRVNFFAAVRYAPSSLAQSWFINSLCSILATKWISMHRGNPPPEAIDELYDDAIRDLERIHAGWQVPIISPRMVIWPFISNVNVDEIYRLRKIRVEAPLSDKEPVDYIQNLDRIAEVTFEW